MSIVINLFVCLMVGAFGVGAGWFVRRYLEQQAKKGEPTDSDEPGFEVLDLNKQDVENLMSTLRVTCEDIAFDVEEHNESMQVASARLLREQSGASDTVVSVLKTMLEANAKLQAQLESAEDKLFDQARQIQAHVLEANTDALTLVSNRRAFDNEMRKAQENYAVDGKPTSVLMVDVDNFKKFNDTYGHQAGDEVLKSVARTLRRKVKRNGHVCRYGGEEFAVIFQGQAVDQCMESAERARVELGRSRVQYGGVSLQVTASAGLAEIDGRDGSDGMIRRADDALYEAKDAGRNCGFWNDGSKNHKMPAIELSTTCDQKEAPDEPVWASELTDARNFHDELGRRLAEWKRGGSTLALGILKVDNWIDLYTKEGEETADLVLKATAQFLKASVRDMDNVAIMGEGKFAMMFPSARLENTVKIGERLRSAISRCEVPSDSGKMNFTVSVGIAEASMQDNADNFLVRAEEAMMFAASQGGNLCYAKDGEKCIRVTKQEMPARDDTSRV